LGWRWIDPRLKGLFMSEIACEQVNGRRSYSWVWLAVGILGFGLLMGERGTFESGWQRSVVAGCSAGLLALCVSRYRKARG
jgi:hypothetical protein